VGVFSFSHPHLSFRVFRVFRGSNRCSSSPLFCGSLALPILFSRPDTRHSTATKNGLFATEGRSPICGVSPVPKSGLFTFDPCSIRNWQSRGYPWKTAPLRSKFSPEEFLGKTPSSQRFGTKTTDSPACTVHLKFGDCPRICKRSPLFPFASFLCGDRLYA
jgi:hypothetical protein